MSDQKIVDLSTFRAQANLKAAAPKDERVWDRVMRTQQILTRGGHINSASRQNAWSDAASALLQYIDNEWPIEKQNPVRADDIAEYAATLFVGGSFDPTLNTKASDLQSTVIDALESADAFKASRQKYGIIVQNLIDAYMGTQTTSIGTHHG